MIIGEFILDTELTARKQILEAYRESRLFYESIRSPIELPAAMSEAIKKMKQQLDRGGDVVAKVCLEFKQGTIKLTTSEGSTIYSVDSSVDLPDWGVSLDLTPEDRERVNWKVFLHEPVLAIDSIDGISLYVFRRRG